jgi:hypothetical protein
MILSSFEDPSDFGAGPGGFGADQAAAAQKAQEFFAEFFRGSGFGQGDNPFNIRNPFQASRGENVQVRSQQIFKCAAAFERLMNWQPL